MAEVDEAISTVKTYLETHCGADYDVIIRIMDDLRQTTSFLWYGAQDMRREIDVATAMKDSLRKQCRILEETLARERRDFLEEKESVESNKPIN